MSDDAFGWWEPEPGLVVTPETCVEHRYRFGSACCTWCGAARLSGEGEQDA